MEKQSKAEDSEVEDELDKTIETLINVHGKLIVCLEQLPGAICDRETDQQLEKICRIVQVLGKKVPEVVTLVMNQRNGFAKRVEDWQISYGKLIVKSRQQQDELDRVNEQLHQLRFENVQQVEFYMKIGSVMGNLLCIASKFPQQVNKWVTEHQTTVEDFFGIVNTLVNSFVSVFGQDLPPLEQTESKFVISLLGTVNNMVATSFGKHFLVEQPAGREFIQMIIGLVPKLTGNAGVSIKRVMLKILNNLSLTPAGLAFLFELKVETILANCLDNPNDLESQQLALRMLQSVTYNLEDVQVFNKLAKVHLIDKIQKVSTSANDCVRKLALEIITHLNMFSSEAKTQSNFSFSSDQ